MTDLTWTNETRRLGDLIPWPRNPRKIGDAEAERLKQSRERFEQPQVIVIGPGDVVYDGHQRLKVWADEWGPDLEVAVRVSSRALTEAEREQLTVMLHRGTMGEWDFEALKGWDTDKLLEWGFDEVELEAAGFELGGEELLTDEPAQARATLAERFVVPPFSVLDARQGYWQERKRAWIALGIQSELGRGGAYPGGTLRDAASLGPDGHTVRGDGRGRPITERERVTSKMAMHNDPMQRKRKYDGQGGVGQNGVTGDVSGRT